MDQNGFGYIYDNSDAYSQNLQWSTDDSSLRSSIKDLSDEINNNLENKICQYLTDLNIETFTNPSLKEDNYNYQLKSRIFKSFDSFLLKRDSSKLLQKRKQLIKLGE